MHIRCKFDCGKQINQSQSGSWQARCAGASLRVNHGPEWGLKVWEDGTGEEANSVFKQHSMQTSKQLKNNKERKATDAVKARCRAARYKNTNEQLKTST